MRDLNYLECRLSEAGFVLSYNFMDQTYRIYSNLVYPVIPLVTQLSQESLSLMSKEDIDLLVLDLELKATFEK